MGEHDRRPDRHHRRVNDQIRAPQVRLLGVDGAQRGIVTLAEALVAAEAAELDLVEVAPDADPPVCRLLDYGKWRYEQSHREREQRRRNQALAIKEMQLRPRISDHDLATKARKVTEMLADGHRVKVVMRSRGRELAHPELAREVLERFVGELAGVGCLDAPLRSEGRTIHAVVAPRRP